MLGAYRHAKDVGFAQMSESAQHARTFMFADYLGWWCWLSATFSTIFALRNVFRGRQHFFFLFPWSMGFSRGLWHEAFRELRRFRCMRLIGKIHPSSVDQTAILVARMNIHLQVVRKRPQVRAHYKKAVQNLAFTQESALSSTMHCSSTVESLRNT